MHGNMHVGHDDHIQFDHSVIQTDHVLGVGGDTIAKGVGAELIGSFLKWLRCEFA